MFRHKWRVSRTDMNWALAGVKRYKDCVLFVFSLLYSPSRSCEWVHVEGGCVGCS